MMNCQANHGSVPKTPRMNRLCLRGIRRNGVMKLWRLYAVPFGFLTVVACASAQKPPLLEPSQGAAIAEELSGAAAHRNLEALAVYHRLRGSRQFHQAAQYVLD